MRRIHVALLTLATVAVAALLSTSLSACGTTTIIYQTATAAPSSTLPATATLAPSRSSSPPPGVWCPVLQGQTPFVINCELYPSHPRLITPPQSATILAGTWVGPQIGSGEPSAVTERMRSPWAADVICGTSDGSNTGMVRILMVAHTSGGDYYSWGDESCGPFSGPDFGNEFFRKASVTVTLTIQPLTSNLAGWQAQLIQF